MATIAAFFGETVTYPLDMIKTRKQLYGELQGNADVPSSFRILQTVIRKEGVLSVFNGLSPALYRHLFYTGIRMPLYEWIRESLSGQEEYFPTKVWLPPDEPESLELLAGVEKRQVSFGMWKAALAGIVSGGVAQFICNPTDLVKVQLQAARRLDHSNRISRVSSFRIMADILRERGLAGLWRGALPNTQRAALVNMGEMTTYDTTKRTLMESCSFNDGPLLQFCSSSVSGFVSSCLGTPTDLIKTRMMRQIPTNVDPSLQKQLYYRGMLDCGYKIIQAEGFFTLYRGFFLIWARMAPWSLTFWLSYEQMRLLCGLQGF